MRPAVWWAGRIWAALHPIEPSEAQMKAITDVVQQAMDEAYGEAVTLDTTLPYTEGSEG